MKIKPQNEKLNTSIIVNYTIKWIWTNTRTTADISKRLFSCKSFHYKYLMRLGFIKLPPAQREVSEESNLHTTEYKYICMLVMRITIQDQTGIMPTSVFLKYRPTHIIGRELCWHRLEKSLGNISMVISTSQIYISL